MGALTGALIGQPRTSGAWRGPLTRTRLQRREGVRAALTALDDAVLRGPPPTVRELARSNGLPLWSVTLAVTTLEHAGLAESKRGCLYLTNSGAACAETLRRQPPWRPAALKSSPDTEIII
jgi:hypothetical protein